MVELALALAGRFAVAIAIEKPHLDCFASMSSFSVGFDHLTNRDFHTLSLFVVPLLAVGKLGSGFGSREVVWQEFFRER